MNVLKEELDRMVDGELSASEEKELLLRCDSNGEWRDLALAYVESQAFERELPGLFSETSPPTLDVAPPAIATDTNSQPKDSWGIWSLAAAVLLALGIGYGAGWGLRDKPVTSPIGSSAVGPVGGVAANDTNKTDAQNSLQWMVGNRDGNGLQQIEVPILSTDDLEETWQEMLLAEREKELLQQMRQRGLNLEHERTLTPVRLQNGQRVVVPVDYFYEKPLQ